jgi:GT2 family glycosyltransferase
MWPLDLPAREVLKLPGDATIPWANFDAVWYALTYPQAVEQCGSDRPAALLDHYLSVGQRQGYSPNRLFDEAWHLQAYPPIAAGVQAGDFASAFDAYCRGGCLDRSPHWLFDELGYRDRYPELGPDTLAANGLVNNYDHYLRFGAAEDRIGHLLFDPAVYLANFNEADRADIRRHGVFTHYLDRIALNEPELPTSVWFDPDWYLRRYPAVASAIGRGEWLSALHHYLCNDSPTEYDPLESFSEAHYLARDPGLLAVIASRHFRNGYMHFLGFGARELRSPSASIDLAWYAGQPAVRADLEGGAAPNAFGHWLLIGKPQGLPSAAPETERLAEGQARALQHRAATALLPNAGRIGYDFTCAATPAVSVVMPVRDGFATTMATVASVRANHPGPIELVLVDCGSRDETASIGVYVPGAMVLRFESDIGWAQAANAGCQFATGTVVLLLESGVRLAPYAIDQALARLAKDPAAGAVGGMVVQPSGVIAQAGGILWNDGGTHDYQRGASPLTPEANFVRSVDFCSAAFLLVRRALMLRLDGFDPACGATGHHAIDLCARIKQSGQRVIYDPSILVFLDGPDQGTRGADAAFRDRHAAYLAARFTRGGPVQVFARHAEPRTRRLLFIEDTIPLRRIGSGFVRSNDVVRVMAESGWQVTVFPVNGCVHDPAHVYRDMPDTAEVMHTLDLARFKAFLAPRLGYYDVIWIARSHNLDSVRPFLAELAAADRRPSIILDTEAVTPLRLAEKARLDGEAFDLDAELARCFANAGICDALVAVTQAEAAVLRDLDIAPVSLVGHMIEPRPTPRPFNERSGLLFVGAIHTPDSPNLDGLIWFTETVLPLIEAALGWETRLTIAGYTAPGIDLARFAHHPRITLRGALADTGPLYATHRLFVAPTRYAAGAPYKVLEAASLGVPVVAAELLRRQLEWVDHQEILAAPTDDPTAFADAVVRAYRDATLWQTVREGALRRVRTDNGKEAFSAAVAGALARPQK